MADVVRQIRQKTTGTTTNVLDVNSCLHYLLPPRRLHPAHKFRQLLPYIPEIPKTSRYYHSFIPFAVKNYTSPGLLT